MNSPSTLSNIILVNCPSGLRIGIDFNRFNTPKVFYGIKNIPSGVHFIFWHPSDEDESNLIGFLIYCYPSKNYILIWNKETDHFDIVDEDSQPDIIRALNYGELSLLLTVYSLDYYKDWIGLSNYISSHLLNTIQPLEAFSGLNKKEIDHTHKSKALLSIDKSLDHSESYSRNLPKNNNLDQESSHFTYSYIPNFTTLKKMPTLDKTKTFMDKSKILLDLVERQYNGDAIGLLGELQIAFISFLFGQNYESFIQWKELICLICFSEEAVQKLSSFYQQFIEILSYQLLHSSDDLFQNIIVSQSFLLDSVISLCELCSDANSLTHFNQPIHKLKKIIQEKFKMSFEELKELDENGPIVVPQDEQFISFNNNSTV